MLTKFTYYQKFLGLNEIASSDKVDTVAYNKIRRCFTQIITNYGFFAELLFNLNIIEAGPNEGIDTMATDAKSIAYSPDFVKKLTEPEVIFVLIHEIMHNANFHFARMSGRDPRLWNCAADYAINLQIDDMIKDLKTSNIKTPNEILLDQKYRNMNAEMIYDLLVKESQQKDGSGKSGQQGSGSNKTGQGGQSGVPQTAGGTPQGDIRKPGSLDGKGTIVVEGNKEFGDAQTTEELEKKWQDGLSQAAVKHAGTGSSSLDRFLRKVNKPKINWRAELKKFVATVYDQLDYAYSNRRYIWQDIHVPGAKEVDTSSFEHVVIAIDTSGSITEDTLQKFGAEMLKLFKQYKIHDVTVIWCDSQIPKNGVQQFKVADASFKLDKLRPVGGGGTSFKPPFEWVKNNLLKKGKVPAFMIYFTDAYGEAPNIGEYGIRGYANRVLWVITENDQANHIKFGKKIYIDKLPG